MVKVRAILTAMALWGILPLLHFTLASPAYAESELARLLPGIEARDMFPGATRIGSPEGVPPVAPAFRGDDHLGFVYITSDYVNSTGYSGKPIHQLVAIDMAGVVRKVLLVKHHEPIVLIGIPEKRIIAVLDNYVGLDVGKMARGELGDLKVDVVSGATVTIMVMDDNIRRSATAVARARHLGGLAPKRKRTGPVATINMELDGIADWPTLVSDSSVQTLKLTLGQVNKAFEESGDAMAASTPEQGPDDESFIDLYAAEVFNSDHWPQSVGRCGVQQSTQAFGARSAGYFIGRRRALFIQGIRLCKRRYI